MPVHRYHLSLWKLTVLTSYLLLWGTVSSGSFPESLPAPSLIVISSVDENTRGAVVLVCRAPEDHRGTMFRLNRVMELVNTSTVPNESQEAYFTVQMKSYSAQDDLYCCLYQSKGIYSSFSPYVSLVQRGVSPSPPLPPPLLSIQPPGGQVKRGQTLSFQCTLPPSRRSVKPEAFLLLRAAGVSRAPVVHPEGLQEVLRASAGTGAFSLGPAASDDGGSYTCLYQVAEPRQGLLNSTASLPVLVTVAEVLPPPNLSLDNQKGESVLVCTGSPSYPGAHFLLYRQGATHPEATQHAPATSHRATFSLSSLPVREDPASNRYQCQYSALLGAGWSYSELTKPLAGPRGTGPTYLDWPLILGSLSALVLFLIALVILGVALKKKVKAAVETKRKRDAELLWTKIQSRDHIVDLTLKRISTTSESRQ